MSTLLANFTATAVLLIGPIAAICALVAIACLLDVFYGREGER